MTSRLLALFLACMVGIPICWCCDVRAEQVNEVVAEEVGCCHGGEESLPVEEETCPCEMKGAAKLAVGHEVLMPVLQVTSLELVEYVSPLSEWQMSVLGKKSHLEERWWERPDCLPVATGRLVCERDCQWLL